MWNVSYNGEVHTFAELGMGNVRRFWKNQAVDKLTFDVTGRSIFDEPIFAGGSTIKIYRDGEKWFDGVISQTPVYGSAKLENHSYEASGAWWFLENLIYQQAWKMPVDSQDPDSQLTNVYKGHVILGQDLSGEKITIGAQIADIVNYAHSCGANLALGEIDIAVQIPFDECKDLSCADAIRRLLRWVPDTACFIDYSTTVPEISFKRRGQMETISLDLLEGDVEQFSIQPRQDLCVPAVVLKFERSNSANGKAWKTVSVQKYPTNAAETGFKTLVLTINLEGMKSTHIAQRITSAAIDVSSLSWWTQHVPWLSKFSNVSIGDVDRISALPHELVDGTVADWMEKTVEDDLIHASVSYQNDDIAVIDQDIAVKIRATDAETGSYSKLMSLLTAEEVPDNLAQSIFESVGILQYDGNLTLVGREVANKYEQFLLNFTSGRTEWEGANATVQEVIDRLDRGEVYIKFGPAKHLGAADLVELTRSGRQLYESRNYGERETAEAMGNGTVEQGVYARVENTLAGDCKYNMLKFVDPTNPDSLIKIDIGDLSQPLNVVLREEDVCESGVLKKRFSLASEAFLAASE
ncbi:MAG: hypothetical protein LBJ94_02470 [Puniceicoccales bacterium]|jgi:hypothetical protein|nr:hypothetical protein [Puniceicoccales bacterium]